MFIRHIPVAVCLALGLITLTGCQNVGVSPEGREGYFTWVDEQGRVRHTRIVRPAESQAGTEPASSEEESGSEKEGSFREDDEFNLENYPDGNQLEEDGYVRPGEPQPYFTWRDAQGNIRVSYYEPDTRSAVEKGRIEPPIELTPASIYQARKGEPSGEPGAAEPEAFAVLGIDPDEQPFFDRWVDACCAKLHRSEAVSWQSGREFAVEVGQESPEYTFPTGPSHYRLVEIPPEGEQRDYIMRLRSFAQDGLFVPSIAFLDTSMEVVRVVTDLVADFTPESWHRHGYLQAYIPVFPSRGERWMVLFTRPEDVDGQTVIEGKRGPEAITHSETGYLSLTAMDEPAK